MDSKKSWIAYQIVQNMHQTIKLAQIEKTIDQNETKLSFLKKDLFSFCCIFAQFLLILTEIRLKIAQYWMDFWALKEDL